METKKPKGHQKKVKGLHIAGNVSVKNGDFVAGDKNVNLSDKRIYVEGDVNNSNVVSGDENDFSKQIMRREKLFHQVLKQIDSRPNTSPEDKEDLKVNVEEIRAEAEKGEDADETFLARRLRNIKRMAPEILEVVTETLINPAAGFALVVKKVAQRAKTSAADDTVKA